MTDVEVMVRRARGGGRNVTQNDAEGEEKRVKPGESARSGCRDRKVK